MSDNPIFQRNLISTSDLSLEEIALILDTTQAVKTEAIPTCLQGKILASCFFEPSTRTRLSFESAMLRLGGQVIGFASAKNTSIQKRESLSDSIRIISAYADAIVLRHPAEGAARLAAEVSAKPVINAGDGANRHPSQTLLDLFTIRETQGTLEGLRIAFVGDLKYGRTVHSLTQACARYPNTRFYFVAPDMLTMPDHICDLLRDQSIKFSFHTDIQDIVDHVDILYMTRIQQERFEAEELRKFRKRYRLTESMVAQAKNNMKILHPLPRVDEIDVEVDRSPYAYYFQQAENGLYLRQALLALLLNQQFSHYHEGHYAEKTIS
ncbi:MAG: aspartate carbamoyltransferase [Gammaproteobacteria bacterium]|nr:aspartate carbamoyltransferase [Gammaproteobacteria bacterium]